MHNTRNTLNESRVKRRRHLLIKSAWTKTTSKSKNNKKKESVTVSSLEGKKARKKIAHKENTKICGLASSAGGVLHRNKVSFVLGFPPETVETQTDYTTYSLI